MTLGQLLDRYYAIVGDLRTNPKEFPRLRAVDLINEGLRQFRRSVEDEWYRQDLSAVSGTAEYQLPDQNVRVQRIAWDDSTMRPRLAQEIVGIDARWQTRTGPNPFEWTTQGVPHNFFRCYPEPTVTTVEGITATGTLGAIVQWNDSGGAPNTFTAGVTGDGELGVVVRIVEEPAFVGELGSTQVLAQTNVKGFTIWGTKKTTDLVEDEDDVPIKNAWQKAPLWYALWHTYETSHDMYNGKLAAYYRNRWKRDVDRAQDRASTPLPWLVFKLGQRTSRVSGRSFLPFAPEGTFAGLGTQSIGWPKRGFWS